MTLIVLFSINSNRCRVCMVPACIYGLDTLALRETGETKDIAENNRVRRICRVS